jgi:hypothetical protein
MQLPPPLIDKLIRHLNRKDWWHVPPEDPTAYRKRGKFLASTYAEAEFWGRPLDEPQRANVARPLVGDEATIEKALFGRLVSDADITVKQRWALDAKMKKAALAKGYDAIVLMSPKCFLEWKRTGKIPRSLELNILTSSAKQQGPYEGEHNDRAGALRPNTQESRPAQG